MKNNKSNKSAIGNWQSRISNGFTLTELLISVAITSLVAVTVYASFRTVLMSYEKSDSSVRMVENARAVLGDITNRLREIPAAAPFYLESISSETDPILTADLDQAALFLDNLGYTQDTINFFSGNNIEYFYFIDTTNNELMRTTDGTTEPLAFNITHLSFLYFSRDTASEQWYRNWDSNLQGLPRSIYIALRVKDDKNRLDSRTFTTLVTLP